MSSRSTTGSTRARASKQQPAAAVDASLSSQPSACGHLATSLLSSASLRHWVAAVRGSPRLVAYAPLGSYTLPSMRPLRAAVAGSGSVSVWFRLLRQLPAPRASLGGYAGHRLSFPLDSVAWNPRRRTRHQADATSTEGTGCGGCYLPAEAYYHCAVGRAGIERLGPRRVVESLGQRSGRGVIR